MPIFLTFATQKGGVGKTTTTANVAAVIHAKTNLKVLVIDVDPQNSIASKRGNEEAELDKKEGINDRLRKGVLKFMKESPDKGFYPIKWLDIVGNVTMSPEESDKFIDGVIKSITDLRNSDYDLVLFDFPGFTAHPAFIKCIALMDYILVPFYPDANTEQSTYDFLDYVIEGKKQGMFSVKDVAAFMWRFTTAKNLTRFVDLAVKLMNQYKVRVFENKIFDAVELQEYSTLYPVDVKGDKSLVPFVMELLQFVGLESKK